jgi:hypothetical protein
MQSSAETRFRGDMTGYMCPLRVRSLVWEHCLLYGLVRTLGVHGTSLKLSISWPWNQVSDRAKGRLNVLSVSY